MRARDREWMARAIELAQRGGIRVRPNPLVGAVVVREGKLVGEGYHPYFGGPHAEAVALKKAGGNARQATLYVTLEPCSSWGKTSPCVDTVIESGIRRVVIGNSDPNPRNHQIGIQKLKKAGIQVVVGILAKEAEKQNAPFFKTMRTGLPWLTLKLAQSLDGKIATARGESRWISSLPSRAFVHRLRSQADAVLVGKNTALLDNPRLQGERGKTRPWRVVLDPKLEVDLQARIFQGPQLTFIAVSERKFISFRKTLNSNSRVLLPIPEKRGKLALKPLLRELASLGAQHVLAEGGGELAWSLLQERLVDQLIWIVAPKVIGGRDAKTSVEGEGIQRLSRAFLLEWKNVYSLGNDWVFEAVLK